MEWYIKVLKNYATFDGRARRKEFWMFTLISGIISIVLGVISFKMGLTINPQRGILDTIYSLAVFVPSIAVGVRRMHDINKKGWFIIIPFYNIYLAAQEGDNSTNEYGDDPKAGIE